MWTARTRNPEKSESLTLAALRNSAHSDTAMVKAHLWRCARVAKPDREPFVLDRGRGIGACGDALTAPDDSSIFGTVEAAHLSGAALARALGMALAAAPNA